jgi:probable rRNA maturation factor
MLDILFDDETETIEPAIEELIRDLLTHASKEEGLTGELELSVTFMTDEEIQHVNAQYRGKDVPTDVISFALEELSEGEVKIVQTPDMPTVLGDIIISLDTANRQASEYGHDLRREVGFLALHGFLHLLGYDHITDDEEKKMFDKQKEILSSFGLER